MSTASNAAEDGPPRGALIAAVVVAVAAVIGVLVAAALAQRPSALQPVPLVTIPAPAAAGEACSALLNQLPDRLDDYARAPLADPAPAGAAAWQRPDGSGSADAVILRCGIDRPLEFVVGAPIQQVDDVAWFRIADTGRTTWVAVDRPVFVALTLPDGSGPTPIQLVSTAVAKAMAVAPIEPGPLP